MRAFIFSLAFVAIFSITGFAYSSGAIGVLRVDETTCKCGTDKDGECLPCTENDPAPTEDSCECGKDDKDACLPCEE